MTLMPGKIGLWLLVTVATTGVALAASRNAPQPEKGEQILNESCVGCHDVRPIQVQALDPDGWTKMVNTMIEKGAPVTTDDIRIVVEYLVTNYGPLPDGAGKNIFLNTCTLCHDRQRVMRNGATREQWEETLGAMLKEGAPLSDEHFPVLLNYLARNFRPK